MRLAPWLFAVAIVAACGDSTAPPPHEEPSDAAPEPPDAAPVVNPVDAAVADAMPSDDDLPVIHDHSGTSQAHARDLVRRALDGLGFDTAHGGPVHSDRVFIGRRYLAWIDQTGFVGKVNGLWPLNGAGGEQLDFLLVDPDGRPVNLFAPGEDGDGRWPTSYQGAEHVEFPSRVVETGDKCGGDWCNQYGLDEAVPYTNNAIPWWQACNVGRINFVTLFEPVVMEETADGLELVYEAKLVKEADGDGNYDGDDCHADYLFPQDRQRHPVYLRVGYQLHTDQPYLDRTMQLRNPEGNPELRGDMSLIGGFVMTRWPNPHYLKRLQRFWRPEAKDLELDWNGTKVPLKASTWNSLVRFAPAGRDVLVSWAGQPLTLSAVAGSAAGRAVTVDNVGPSDNDDIGACLCSVHGGIEMGGGLLHADRSLPIAAGASSIVAVRRLTVPTTGAAPVVRAMVYQAESQLSHERGRAEADGWSCNTGADGSGHLSYGPYSTTWGGSGVQAKFWMMVDNNTARDDLVVTLDVYDATAKQTIASRELHRHEWKAASAYQAFTLNAELEGRSGHAMEARVYWHDTSYVRLDKIEVRTVD